MCAQTSPQSSVSDAVGYDRPAEVGMSLREVATPALVIDLDAFERNLERMRVHAAAMGITLRAHAKTHKSADIALIQMQRGGAVGVCCQKVSEAEALARAGITDILIANEVTAPRQIARLVALAQKVRLKVCVDDATVASALSAAAAAAAGAANSQLDVLVEIDCGAGRCGVAPGADAVALAQHVATLPHLTFAGIQSYHGGAQHIADYAQRQAAIAQACAVTAQTLDGLAAAGFPCPIVTGAGTGTYPFEGQSGIYSELQCGSYIFMDVDYGRIAGETGGLGFENALFVLATVISHPTPTRAVCDAGLKALAVDSGLPEVTAQPLGDLPGWAAQGVMYQGVSDEHGTLDDPQTVLSINDPVLLIPGHCDPTCNLHDWYVGVRNGTVEAVWPVTARGKVF